MTKDGEMKRERFLFPKFMKNNKKNCKKIKNNRLTDTKNYNLTKKETKLKHVLP